MKSVQLIFLVVLGSMFACEASATEDIRRTVHQLDSEHFRTSDGRMIRTIREVSKIKDRSRPLLEVTLIDGSVAVEDFDTLKINGVSATVLDKEIFLDFKTARSVDVNQLKMVDDELLFRVEYASSEPPTFSVIVKCMVNAESDKLQQPICRGIYE